MDKKYIEDNEIEIKYLRNQLTPEEVEEFEVYLMENSELVDQLESDYLLAANLNAISRRAKTKSKGSTLLFGWFQIGSFTAGLVALLVFQNLLPITSGRSKNQLNQIVYLAQTRGVTKSTEGVSLVFENKSFQKDSNDKFILALDVALGEESIYQVSIHGPIEPSVGQEDIPTARSNSKHRPDVQGILTVVESVSDYEPGVYEVNVRGGGSTLSYRFSLAEGRSD